MYTRRSSGGQHLHVTPELRGFAYHIKYLNFSPSIISFFTNYFNTNNKIILDTRRQIGRRCSLEMPAVNVSCMHSCIPQGMLTLPRLVFGFLKFSQWQPLQPNQWFYQQCTQRNLFLINFKLKGIRKIFLSVITIIDRRMNTVCICIVNLF